MLERIKSMMDAEMIDGFLISSPQNIRYLTGYQENYAYVLITGRSNYVFTDGRYQEIARKAFIGFEVINWQLKEGKLKQAINEIVTRDKVKRLGFEAEHITYKHFADLYDMVQTEITPVVGLVERFRAIKAEDELLCLRKACDISDKVFTRLLTKIRLGMTERELASLCDYYISLEGGSAKTTDSIILGGARTSLIVASPSDYRLQEGDLLMMNFGVSYNGYIADFTRTIALGKATDKQHEIYAVVKKAQQAAINEIKAGALAKTPFYASEKIISEAGYREYHYEGIGHGLGLFIHETPFLDKNSKMILEKNNVLTVEPGLYLPGWGGIRIEDVIVVTDDGVEFLTKSDRDLIELNLQ